MGTPLYLLPVLLYILLLLVTVPVYATGTVSELELESVSVAIGTDNNNNDDDNKNERIHIAIVSCGASRAPEALASMRSALLMTQHPLSFHIFHNADDGNDVYFTKALSRWQQQKQKQQQQQKQHQQVAESAFDFFLYQSNLSDDYATLFAPCACQRLFLHESLPVDVDRVLYVDSDTLFLADVGILWKQFETALQTTQHTDTAGTTTTTSDDDDDDDNSNSNNIHNSNDSNDKPMSSILAALVPEHQATSKSAYYRDQTNHPYYHDDHSVGLNSGVLLWNVRRLRAHGLLRWNEVLTDYLHHDNYTLQYYDQDLLNIYFHFHPEELLVLSCDWNFRSDHCFFANQHCSAGSAGGDGGSAGSATATAAVSILHGSRGTFHAPTTPLAERFSVRTFQTLYRAFSLFPTTELGSVRAVRDAWLWWSSLASSSSSSDKMMIATNHCDLLLPSMVTRILTEALAAATAAAAATGSKPHRRLSNSDDEL